jgi:threonine synthase
MLKYVSNTGGGDVVDFETAILDGFAADGGLYVPEELPKISKEILEQWSILTYTELAFEILSLFIDRSIMSEIELKDLIQEAYQSFESKDIIPLHQLKSRKDTYIMELFHGPTLSFKDIGQAFLVNLVHFFLKKRNEYKTLIIATTGDTGPAAAHFAAGKSTLDTWILYPKNMITSEQERQMTTLPHNNIHSVGVYDCPDGGDDLDFLIAKLYADNDFKDKLKLSSVNSINWGRVMMQAVHYFYGYFQVVHYVGEEINMSVPSGGFGNLCGGSIARMMGLPVHTYVVASNKNDSLNRIFSTGVFSKAELYPTLSSAIDILFPYNFWRYLYFIVKDPNKIKEWRAEYENTGYMKFDSETFELFSKGYLSKSISDKQTLSIIGDIYKAEEYLLDPHGAISLVAADSYKEKLSERKLICLATAHPAKFPDITKKALNTERSLPEAGKHTSLEKAKEECERVYLCNYSHLENAIRNAMENNWKLNR